MPHLPTGRPLFDSLRIAIATARGRPYYHLTSLLRRLGVHFESLLPAQIPDYTGHLVFTTASEFTASCNYNGISLPPVLFFEDVCNCPPSVTCGLMMRAMGMCSSSGDEIVIGIDPGQRCGLSVSYCGHEIESSIHSSVAGLVSQIICLLGRLPARRRLVRIGDGDMKTANEIIRVLNLGFCSSFETELVDESKTSLKLKNFNRRGRRDILSARCISRRDGHRRHKMVMPFSITG